MRVEYHCFLKHPIYLIFHKMKSVLLICSFLNFRRCQCAVVLGMLFLASFQLKAQDTIHLKKYAGNLKKIEVEIAGRSFDFLFDTGGGNTFISPSVAKQLRKQPYGQVIGYRMSGEQFTYQRCDSVLVKIGGLPFLQEETGVWDLMKILPEGLPRLDGVLSLKSFADQIITLDLANNLLILENPSFLGKGYNLTLLSSRFATGLAGDEVCIFLQMQHRSKKYWFLLDSGNLRDLLLSKQTAIEWGLQKDSTAADSLAFALGDHLARAKVAVEPIIYDGVLNFATLQQFVFVLDLRRRQVWLRTKK
jgi:hypothetical protein